MYIFPTKALAHDQLRALRSLASQGRRAARSGSPLLSVPPPSAAARGPAPSPAGWDRSSGSTSRPTTATRRRRSGARGARAAASSSPTQTCSTRRCCPRTRSGQACSRTSATSSSTRCYGGALACAKEASLLTRGAACRRTCTLAPSARTSPPSSAACAGWRRCTEAAASGSLAALRRSAARASSSAAHATRAGRVLDVSHRQPARALLPPHRRRGRGRVWRAAARGGLGRVPAREEAA